MADVTRKTVIAKALNLDVWTDEEKEVLAKMKVALEKKSSKPRKNVAEIEGYKADILAYLADGRGRTATEIGNEVGISCQRASAILKKLVDEEKVGKTEAKGKNPAIFVAIQ